MRNWFYKTIPSCFFMIVMLAFSGTGYVQAGDRIANVVYLDGSAQRVEKLKFVYTWYYAGDEKYLNHTFQKTESDEFHYIEEVNGVSLDRRIPGNSIKKIELSWKKEFSWYEPTSITITLTSGKSIVIQNSVENKMRVASTFLQNLPLESVKDESVLSDLSVDGTALIEKQQGKFSGSITTDFTSDDRFHANKLIKEIAF